MPISWNEIRARAARFAEDWKDARYEKGETQSFWNAFFEAFGQSRRSVAVYERQVAKLGGNTGFIDLFWPGVLLVEQKSAGRSLGDARGQAEEYFLTLKEAEKPRYILLSDFQTFELLDLEENTEQRFRLADLPEKVKLFAFVAGYQRQSYKDQDPANIKASNLMSALHRELEESGYAGASLEHFLVRVMFCLFADSTGIFPPSAFRQYIEERTSEDGSDVGSRLLHLFEVLNTADNKRQTTLDEDLAAFPYVNGRLFADHIDMPSFNANMRRTLLDCCYFDWSKVSPALFGSLFQAVMLPARQRQGGAHYTSERNILKLIHPLFLDDLRAEFGKIKAFKGAVRKKRLEEFHKKLAALTFFDPACGCGNFLILAYRELRELEIEVLKELHPGRARVLDIEHLSKVDVDQFYGIEIEEFPARVAEAAMWLVDHQMNMKLSDAFGLSFVRLPLQKAAHIRHANALTTDWSSVLSPKKCSYILSNPPFVGSKFMTAEQRRELKAVFNGANGEGVLDYVCSWYGKAAQYILGTSIKAAFVSTNSITQGEQVGVLWMELLCRYGVKIHFAHRTFRWTIDEKKAKGMHIAAVYVVIIGFAAFDAAKKYLYEYEDVNAEPHKARVNNINPYLVDGPDVVIASRTSPLCKVPPIGIGNKPIDDGNYLFTPQEKAEFLKLEPHAKEFFRRWVGSEEFLNGVERWVLWLGDCPPEKLRKMPHALKRVEAVKKFRLASKSESTRKIAATPTRFHVENMPDRNYLVIPGVSSEKRDYIPMAILGPKTICSNLVSIIPGAALHHFGVLTSAMHMAWARHVCGRLEGRYRYSNHVVYNNFPWPESSAPQKRKIEEAAQTVLDARAKFQGEHPAEGRASLADLYDSRACPAVLRKAHHALDKAVEQAYRRAPFRDDRERVEHLFGLYQKLTAPLTAKGRRGRRG